MLLSDKTQPNTETPQVPQTRKETCMLFFSCRCKFKHSTETDVFVGIPDIHKYAEEKHDRAYCMCSLKSVPLTFITLV